MASALLRSCLVFLALFASRRAAAQASPFFPLDDVRRPLFEHLIARGDLLDPTPLDRPWKEKELSVLPTPSRRLARLTARAGGQAFTQGRRDLLQRGGSSGLRGYAEAGGLLVSGPWIVAVRGMWENRLKSDPDWRGSQELADDHLVVRIAEAYAGIQLSWATLIVGQRDRNWGPPNIPGIAVSDAGYPRPDIEIQLGGRTLRFTGIATRMKSTAGSEGGRIERYFVAHRLSIQPAATVTLAAWEAAVIAGEAAQLQTSTRAVAPLLLIPAVFASRSHRNEIVGGQISWRPRPRLRLGAEVAIDDWNFDDTGSHGPLAVAGETGVRHTVNADHLMGSNRTSLEVRITAMLGILLERGTP